MKPKFRMESGDLIIGEGCQDMKFINFTVKERLGKGTYGEVYKIEKENGDKGALKIVKYIPGKGIENFSEIDMLCRLEHPNILHSDNFIFMDNSLAITMPLGSDMLTQIRENGPLPYYNDYGKRLIMGLISAVYFLHIKRYYHCDIKPENLLLINGKIVLGDLGMSGKSLESYADPCCSYWYASPQRLYYVACRKFGEAKVNSSISPANLPFFQRNVDINYDDLWSMSMTIIYLCTGIIPFRTLYNLYTHRENFFMDLIHQMDMKIIKKSNIYFIDGNYLETIFRKSLSPDNFEKRKKEIREIINIIYNISGNINFFYYKIFLTSYFQKTKLVMGSVKDITVNSLDNTDVRQCITRYKENLWNIFGKINSLACYRNVNTHKTFAILNTVYLFSRCCFINLINEKNPEEIIEACARISLKLVSNICNMYEVFPSTPEIIELENKIACRLKGILQYQNLFIENVNRKISETYQESPRYKIIKNNLPLYVSNWLYQKFTNNKDLSYSYVFEETNDEENTNNIMIAIQLTELLPHLLKNFD